MWGVRSRDPVSTTTISSTTSRMERRQPPRTRSSFRTMRAAESSTSLLPDETLIPQLLQDGGHFRLRHLGEAVCGAHELRDARRRVLACAELEDEDSGVVQVVHAVALGLMDHEPVVDLLDLEAAGALRVRSHDVSPLA